VGNDLDRPRFSRASERVEGIVAVTIDDKLAEGIPIITQFVGLIAAGIARFRGESIELGSRRGACDGIARKREPTRAHRDRRDFGGALIGKINERAQDRPISRRRGEPPIAPGSTPRSRRRMMKLDRQS
jgi:hypothetical protein